MRPLVAANAGESIWTTRSRPFAGIPTKKQPIVGAIGSREQFDQFVVRDQISESAMRVRIELRLGKRAAETTPEPKRMMPLFQTMRRRSGAPSAKIRLARARDRADQ
jgi:hypothetical protein